MKNVDLNFIKGLIFDLDGTLIHSTIDFLQMRQRTFARMIETGIPELCLDRTETISTNLRTSYRYLVERGETETARSLCSDAGKIMKEIEMFRVSETKAVEGARGAIEQLIGEGYSVAVLTRGSRRYTESALTVAGLADLFICLVCRDDHPDEEAKPNPISMIRAAGIIGVPPESCLMVGDHVMDLECARSAGSVFIGVLSGAMDRSAWMELEGVVLVPDVSYLPDLLVHH
jgi:phosphoglycolate phosphatase